MARSDTTSYGAGGGLVRLRVSLARTAGFAAVYAVALVVGRMTVIEGSGLALVWPAAGVAVVWFSVQRRSRTRWVDVCALTVIALVGNAATGIALMPSAVLAGANLVQAMVFVWLLGRWRPFLWGAGGSARLSAPRDLAYVLGATLAAAAASGAVGLTGLWVAGGPASWLMVADWMARQVAGIFVLGTAGLWFGPAVTGFRARHGSLAGWWRATDRALRDMPTGRVVEYLAVTICSVTAYLLGFVFDGNLPLAFPLIALTVWAAVRLRTGFVVAHHLIFGAAVVGFTVHGVGPMAAVTDPQTRALLAQLYVVLIAAVGLALALGRDERAALVAELTTKEKEQARHAALLSAIIDSMADGLSLVDADGTVLLRNPAGVRLLGPAGTIRDMQTRVHHLDGSPITAQALPPARALAGQQVDPVDLLFTDPQGRDVRVLRVSATPLPGCDGTRNAVVLYHDVTAERRHRDQLTQFAGVVAHDLQSPLTTVEGWTETATDALDADQPAIGLARDGLARVARAAARMRGLINDLLAYTAAGDADLAPATVDLTGMVTDVAAGRADAATAAGQPVPQVALGRLHPVHADAGAVRQLLENLIGNAIKYTAPGVTPHVRVTSTPLDGRVQVTIADNGIGIPAGQHDAIFDSFHRAHPGATYTGTGLGLAICQRIVTRHGGTITAEDNPGGGSRFTFTLPATATLTSLPDSHAAPRALPTTPAPVATARLLHHRAPAAATPCGTAPRTA
ncbi:PAS domain-containing protein [Krasilnikovia cinnamomea]|uniref:Sensor-like histidine kinase SenX3 n=1 Tax=Krasilnikovia cinnamomea TaxID=349313 RepID=A0A4Q7ZRX2_9ACTN|nr:ATP-binding protein [Krasilnikovia cinnamomea]RZU53561.1 PAS domain-containing protein [Krasilnikovia cinnamomea]